MNNSSKPSRVWTVLNRPLFGTRVIPKDARVDPDQFPAEEYPIYCPQCDYLLRGLPEKRCPECGKSFDPGRLIVEQYALEWNHFIWIRTRRMARWGLIILLIGGLCGIALLTMANRILFSPSMNRLVSKLDPFFMFELLNIGNWVMNLMGILFAIACLAIALIIYRRGARKRKIIIQVLIHPVRAESGAEPVMDNNEET